MPEPDQIRLLLVDDDPSILQGYRRPFERRGWFVATASNGKEAVDLVKAQPFDVIVSDIAMPMMTGLELILAVREHDLDVPVILMTGAPDLDTATKAISYGACEYLSKPVELPSMLDSIRRAASLHDLARAKREALAVLGRQSAEAGDRAGLEASLNRAMASLWMAYQPIVRVSNRSLYGHEALLRSGEAALPHPGAVLDAAERLGKLADLGRAVRAAAAHPVVAAEDSGFLFVNLHAQDLLDASLASAHSPLSKIASRVVLEITERAALDHIDDARGRVAALREMGFRIAIDDLGAGYAGLTSFAQLEPEIVKLDMSLVRGVDGSKTKQKLIRSMAQLCTDMGMLVVAEGVETAGERDAVVDLGCDLLQGYLLAKPGKPFPQFSW